MQLKEITNIFEKRFGSEYRVFRAPGRINLIGEHTDYNMGFVMPAAISNAIYLAIQPNNSNKVNIVAANPDFDITINLSQKDPEQGIPGWAKYPLGVILEMKKTGHNVEGFDAVFGGDIPTGAGLSSSAALESVFGTAFNALFEFNLSQYDIAKTGQMAEHNTVGVKCGIMDQFASVFGKKNHFMRLDCRDLSFEMFPFQSEQYQLLLIDTCVKHSLASSAYNERREQCEAGVKIIRKDFPEVESLRDVTSEMLNHSKETIPPIVLQRCEYVVEENERLLQTSEMLQKSDLAKVGELLLGSHYGLKDKYEVSCPELDFLVKCAENEEGVAGARMMGGGFGGCTINIVKKNVLYEYKKQVAYLFNKHFGADCKFYEVAISDGAGEIS